MRGAEILVKTLEQYGVKYIFGLPGDATQFFRALTGSSIKFITVRDERGAGYAADAYARLSGKPGIVYISRGPGGANALSGIASAFLDNSPVIFICDQKERRYLHRGTHMFLEFEKVFSHASKSADLILRARDIAPAFSRAWALSQTPPKGPACLIIPEDVFDEETEFKLKKILTPKIKDGSLSAVKIFGKLLEKSGHPIIVLGPGTVEHCATKEFRSFIKKMRVPYFTARNSKGVLTPKDPFNFGIAYGGEAIPQNTDLVITIGADTAERPWLYHWMQRKNIAHLSISGFVHPRLPWFSPKHNFTVNLKNFFLKASGIKFNKKTGTRVNAVNWRKKVAKDTHQAIGGSLLVKMLDQDHLGSILKYRDPLIVDTGLHKALALYAHDALGPNNIFSIGLSAIGFAVPASLGAMLARPRSKTVAICGDGGFLMSISELETISRLKLPAKIIVVADGSYGLIKERQNKNFGGTLGTDFTNPDFKYLSRAFGFQYIPVRTINDLKKARNAVISDHKPSIIVLYEKYKYK